ncbi:hypothetical protein DFJ77DRAFT_510652 [Powellomyces hirtus]|nr:hypothetical protein DFJ77DRAFT_510652 [Powellomyces hirtus]
MSLSPRGAPPLRQELELPAPLEVQVELVVSPAAIFPNTKSTNTVHPEPPVTPLSAPAVAVRLDDGLPAQIVLDRGAVVTQLLRIILVLFFIPGVSLWLTFALCVSVNVGYSIFAIISKDPTAIRTLPFVAAFSFYLHALARITRSVIRTAVRLAMRVWTSKFGAGESDIWPGRIIDNSVLTWKPWAIRLFLWLPRVPDDLLCHCAEDRRTTRRGCGCVEDLSRIDWDQVDKLSPIAKFSRRLERFKLLLFIVVILILLLTIPLVLSIVDFWSTVGILSAFSALGSLSCILLTNVIARILRAGRYLQLFYRGAITPARRRAMYVASVSFTHDRHRRSASTSNRAVKSGNHVIVDSICDVLMRETMIAIVASIVLGSLQFYPVVVIPCGVTFILALLVRLRRNLPLYSWMHWLHRHIDTLSSYDGISARPAWALFFIRLVWYLVGFGSLVLLDVEREDLQTQVPERWVTFVNLIDVPANILRSCIWAFYGIFFIRDLTFLLPDRMLSNKNRAILMLVAIMAMLTAAIVLRSFFPLYTYSTALLTAILAIEYRDARIFCRPSDLHSTPIPNLRRANRRVASVFCILLVAVAISIIVGISLSHQKPRAIAIPTSNSHHLNEVSHYCNPTFPYPSAAPLDLGGFINIARAAYQKDAVAFLGPLLDRHNLSASLVPTPATNSAYYIHLEIVSRNNSSFIPLQIISIRGTARFDDIFQDLYLFAAPALLRYSSYFGTFVALWPRETLANIVRIIFRYAANPSLTYFYSIEDYVASLVSKPSQTGQRFFITGHSLGGALALLAGASVGVPAVAFSAPGLASSYLAFGVQDREAFYTGGLNNHAARTEGKKVLLLSPLLKQTGGVIPAIMSHKLAPMVSVAAHYPQSGLGSY